MFCLFKLYDNHFFFLSFFLTVVCIHVYFFPLNTNSLALSLSFHISIFYFGKVIWIHCSLLFSKKICTKQNPFFSIVKQKKKRSNPYLRSFTPLFEYLCHLSQLNKRLVSFSTMSTFEQDQLSYTYSFDLPTLHKKKDRTSLPLISLDEKRSIE